MRSCGEGIRMLGAGKEGRGREITLHKWYYSIVIVYWSIGHYQLETTSISLLPGSPFLPPP